MFGLVHDAYVMFAEGKGRQRVGVCLANRYSVSIAKYDPRVVDDRTDITCMACIAKVHR